MASGKDVHACRNCQGDRAEQQFYAVDVPERLAKAEGVKQLEDAGHGSGFQPGARTVEILPEGDAAAEDQTVCRLQILHDLVGVQNEVTGQSHNGARHKCQRQHQRHIFPRPVDRPGMQQDFERRLHPCQDGLHRGARRWFSLLFFSCHIHTCSSPLVERSGTGEPHDHRLLGRPPVSGPGPPSGPECR